jgi:hypothetical protein
VDELLWVVVCFGAVLVLLGVFAIVLGIVLTRPVTENERAPEKNVWIIIAEKVLGWFDKLIGLLLSDDAPRSKRLTALGLMLILLGALCLAGGLYGIVSVGDKAAPKAVAQVVASVELV